MGLGSDSTSTKDCLYSQRLLPEVELERNTLALQVYTNDSYFGAKTITYANMTYFGLSGAPGKGCLPNVSLAFSYCNGLGHVMHDDRHATCLMKGAKMGTPK